MKRRERPSGAVCVLLGMRSFIRAAAKREARARTPATGDFGSHADRMRARKMYTHELTRAIREEFPTGRFGG